MKSEKVNIKIAVDEKRKSKERIMAIYRINNQRILYKIAMKDENPDIRYAAINRIKFNKFLKTIAKYDEKMVNRLAAIDRITESYTLYAIVMSKKYDISVRERALNKLKHIGYLKMVAHSNIEYKLIRIAERKLY